LFGDCVTFAGISRTSRSDRNSLPQLPSDTMTSGASVGGKMAGSDKRKQSLYFPEEMLKEIGDEAARQDRSLSWIVQKAWKTARKDIMKIPSVNELPGGGDDKRGAGE
jgi:uncharacterized small protein (TIGR04563 family)